MKKILTILLIVLIAFSFSAPSFAEGKKETWDKMGFTLTYPEEFSNTRGIVLPNPYPVVKDGIYSMTFDYYAFPKEESDVYNEKTKNGGLSAEDTARILDAMGTLLLVIGIDGDRDAADLIAEMDLEGFEEGDLTAVGKHGDITYFAVTAPDAYGDYADRIPPEYAEEYRRLQASLVDVLKNAEYFAPRSGSADLLGTVLRFETTDLDGNVVKSEELFAAHAVTMINIWATWCGPCKAEMPELGELARRLEAEGKDAAIVGICNDADEEPDTCREILAERGVDYLNLLPFVDMEEKLYLTTLPTTLFVNRDGLIMLAPIEGVPEDLSRYGQLIDAFVGAGASAEQSSEPSRVVTTDKGVYRVIVTDSSGAPVKEVMVQFCSDTTCTMGKTDENGVAVFEMEEGPIYTIHVLKVPEGYVKNGTEYQTDDTYCDVYIPLEKAT